MDICNLLRRPPDNDSNEYELPRSLNFASQVYKQLFTTRHITNRPLSHLPISHSSNKLTRRQHGNPTRKQDPNSTLPLQKRAFYPHHSNASSPLENPHVPMQRVPVLTRRAVHIPCTTSSGRETTFHRPVRPRQTHALRACKLPINQVLLQYLRVPYRGSGS